jgi:anti-sigma regulatory factor (Ser/Thr protein kinase)
LRKDAGRGLAISLYADMAFLPLSTSFVENGATALGLGQKEAKALTLATEEIFAYLCRIGSTDQGVEVRCSGGSHYVQIDFLSPVEDFNMRLFNLTATVSIEDEAALEEIGLLIASRFVDRLEVRQQLGQGVRLTLIKEKAYPAIEEGFLPSAGPLAEFSVKRPLPEHLKTFVQLANAHYPSWLLPGAFRFPGKVVDMVGGGEYDAALGLGPVSQVGGGIIWHWAGLKTVECFGPYIFGQASDTTMPEALLEACLGAIAKTNAVGLFTRLPTDDFPRQHFESLGALTLFDKNGLGRSLTSYFRQMKEDLGTSSWCHPEIEAFIRREYERLVLAREVLLVKDAGETKSPFSVLSAEFDRPQSMATLRPIHSGLDAEENMVSHLKLFSRESLWNVFFAMDLGLPWEADFTPGLLRNGFSPRMVIPYAGEGDLVIFQLGNKQS